MRSFQWRITIPFIVLIIISMWVLGIYLTTSVKNSRIDNLRFQLRQEARITAEAVLPLLNGQNDIIDALVDKLGQEIDTRITIIAPDGKVLGDSLENPATMENHATRPEVIDALATGFGESTRFSTTVNEQMMYVAVTVTSNDEILGITRVALPLTAVNASVNQVTRVIILATGIITMLAALATWLITKRITQPIRELTRASMQIANGNFGQKIAIKTKDEAGQLARAFNEMSFNLKTTIDSMSMEKNRLSSILTNMADGVIMTDTSGNIVLANRAASSLLNFREEEALGKSLIEAVHDHEIDEMLKKCLATNEEQTTQFESGSSKNFLRVIAVPFWNQERLSGAIILLQDLTELKNMQTMRRELIGNISHELRTPIAGIKAMAETLLNGAINEKDIVKDFISRIESEADRLTQMVAELTQLSRIESGRAELKKEPVNLNTVIDEVISELSPLAEKGDITLFKELKLDLPDIPLDRDRIRQSIINLVHNAIKFNKPRGKVTISTHYDSKSVSVNVADTGIGISKDDLPHVFERFFKADKARTGGGSGLGLAIAKHTAQVHGGEIYAQSEEDKGSIFTLSLPRA